VSLSVEYDDRAVFQYQRIEVVGYLWELGMQFGSDAAGGEHHRQAVTPRLVDGLHGFWGYVAARCKGAVEVDCDHFEKRHSPSHLYFGQLVESL